MKGECIGVYGTFPDQETAGRLARTLVEEELIACANLFPIASVYRWKGAIEEADEWGAWLKTRRELFPALQERVRELHPYEVPALVAYEIAGGIPAYLAWIEESTRPVDACG